MRKKTRARRRGDSSSILSVATILIAFLALAALPHGPLDISSPTGYKIIRLQAEPTQVAPSTVLNWTQPDSLGQFAPGYVARDVSIFGGKIYLPISEARPITPNTAALWIGRGGPTTDAAIDEVRISNRSRTADEISAVAAGAPLLSDAATVALWRFDEGSGQTTADLSQHQNTGTLGSNTSVETIDPNWTDGRFGKALSFNSTEGDYVTVNHSSSLNLSGTQATIEAWVYPRSFVHDAGIVRKWGGGPSGYALATSSSGFYCIYGTGAGYNTAIMYGLSTNRWYHVACTYNGTHINLYVNGTLSASAVQPWIKFSGDFTSAPFGTGSRNAVFGNISWDATVPANTNLTLQTRTSNDSVSWSNWSSSYTNPAGSPIVSPPAFYIQYKAFLSTTNYLVTPTLNNVAITYSVPKVCGNQICEFTFGENSTNCPADCPPPPPPGEYAVDANTVGLWHFNEGGGSTANDTSGVTGPLNLLGSASFSTDSRFGASAIAFRADVLGFAESNRTIRGLDPNGSWTFDFWLNAEYVTESMFLQERMPLASGTSGRRGPFLYGSVTDGKLRLSVYIDNVTSPIQTQLGPSIPLFIYTHIAIVRDKAAGLFRFYMNGTERSVIADPGGPITHQNLRLGLREDNSVSTTWSGKIDELRISNRSRTAEEILAAATGGPPPTGPVCANSVVDSGEVCDANNLAGQTCATRGFEGGTLACAADCKSFVTTACTFTLPLPTGELAADAATVALWRFDEGSGQTTADLSQHQNTGTLGSNTSVETIDPNWTDGRFGKALSFNSTEGDYVNVNHSFSLNLSGTQATIEAWVNISSFNSDAGIVSKLSGSTGYVLATHGGNRIYCIFLTAYPFSSPYNTAIVVGLVNNTWYHIACTFDGASIKLYINGTLRAAAAQPWIGTRNIATNDLPLRIGKSGGGIFSGTIDEVRISNRTRTAEEIAAAAGVPPPTMAPGPACGNQQCELGENSTTCAIDCPLPTDITPPGPITNFRATKIGTTAVELAWSNPADQDYSGAEIFLNGIKGGDTPSSVTSLISSSLSPNKTYNYALRSFDASGNKGAFTNITFTTLPYTVEKDTTPPGPVDRLLLETAYASSLYWLWLPPPFDADYAGAVIYLNNMTKPISRVPMPYTWFEAKGLLPNTTYTIGVQPFDHWGNLGQIQTSTGRTLPATMPWYQNLTAPVGASVGENATISVELHTVNATLTNYWVFWGTFGPGAPEAVTVVQSGTLPAGQTTVPLTIQRNITTTEEGWPVYWQIVFSDTKGINNSVSSLLYVPSEEKNFVAAIEAQKAIIFTVTNPRIDFTNYSIVTNKALSNVTINISELNETLVPIAAPYIPYSYSNVTKTGVADADITNVTFNFKIALSWFAAKNINKQLVRIGRLPEGGSWDLYNTTYRGEDASFAYYTATLPGLSIIGITGGATQQPPAQTGPICGNSLCEAGESYSLCPSDCQAPVSGGAGGGAGGAATPTVVGGVTVPSTGRLVLRELLWQDIGYKDEKVSRRFTIVNDGNTPITGIKATTSGELGDKIKISGLPTSLPPTSNATFVATIDLKAVEEGLRGGRIEINSSGGAVTLSLKIDVRLNVTKEAQSILSKLDAGNYGSRLTTLRTRGIDVTTIDLVEKARSAATTARDAFAAGNYSDARSLIAAAAADLQNMEAAIASLERLGNEQKGGRQAMVIVAMAMVLGLLTLTSVIIIRRREKSTPTECHICGKMSTHYYRCARCGKFAGVDCSREYEGKVYCLKCSVEIGLSHVIASPAPHPEEKGVKIVAPSAGAEKEG